MVIVVRLIGGLGNQMFQYATGRAVAEHHRALLLLDISGFESYNLRRYELDCFDIDARPARADELTGFSHISRKQTIVNRILNKIGVFASASRLREASFAYDHRIETLTLPVYLDGYWQSEKYFAQLAPVLRREFTLKDSLDKANREMMHKIERAGARAVSLHVRRGDYVSNPHTAQHHGVCTLDYYRSAVERISRQIANPHFFVFSDDPAWVQANLEVPHATTLVQVNDADHGMFDLALMKTCGHHIIANSSFSWWGAWLNPSPEKIVIAPQRWFRESTSDTRDLLPSAWIRL